MMLRNRLVSIAATVWFSMSLASLSAAQDATIEERFQRARALVGADELEAAIRMFHEIIAERPDFGPAYKRLADAYLFLRDLEGARRYFTRLLARDSANAYAHYALAQVDTREGDFDRAIDHLEQTIG